MKFVDVLYISLKNSYRNMQKTLLSVIAVTIGIASVVLISTIGNGAYMQADHELSKLGIDGLSLRLDGTSDEKLDVQIADDIMGAVEGVGSTMPFKLKYSSSRLRKSSSDTVIWGVGSNMVETMDLTLLYGREISTGDIHSNSRVVLIDEAYAKSAYKRGNIVGKTLRLSLGGHWENFEIIGVISSQTEALGSLIGVNIGTFAYIPYTVVNEVMGESGIQQVAIRCSEESNSAVVANAVVNYMSRTHPTEGRYVVENITGYLEQMKGIVSMIQILVTAIGGISLFVAGVGVMNSMLSNLAERRREIGIYLAVGAVPRDIVKNVILESLIIYITGGILGCILGIFGAATVCGVLGISFYVSISNIIFALIISNISGLLFGCIPAIKASLLNPIDALNRI